MQRMKNQEREEALKMLIVPRDAEDSVDISEFMGSKEEDQLFDEFIKTRKIEYRKRQYKELRVDLRDCMDQEDISCELFNENASDKEYHFEEKIDEFHDFETFKF